MIMGELTHNFQCFFFANDYGFWVILCDFDMTHDFNNSCVFDRSQLSRIIGSCQNQLRNLP